MKPDTLLRYAAIILIISVNIGCDQVSKAVVRNKLEYHEQIQLMNDNVILTKVENSGAFLNLGDSLNPAMKNLLLLVLPVFSILFGLWWLFQHSNNIGKPALIAWCSIMGGGIGNIFDRMMHGSVTDFLFIQYGFFRTGIFNAADVSITLGVCLVVAQQVYKTKKI